MRDRVIRDEIHRDIFVPAHIARLIDTREFQRLRNIQQLATCHYVFPAATHNRFSHSLGAYHLAKTLCDHLNEVQPGIISDEDTDLVSIAALLHDIGHPPFSHLLETDKVFANFHSHEDWGKMMLESEETEIGAAIREVLGQKRTGRLFALYSGKSEYEGEEIAPFLREIVSSQLDVDRMDYMIRDQANSGAQIGGFDSARVIRALRVGDDGRLYAMQWGLPAIEAYLVTRYHLYSQVYFHKVNQLTQEYLVRVLSRARTLANEGKLELSKSLHNMLCNENLSVKEYVRLTDADINGVLMDWADNDDKILSNFAKRLVSRRDYHKSIRIGELTHEMSAVVIPRIRPIVTQAGYSDEDIITATIKKKGYMPYSQGIMLEDGRDVIESSPLIQSLHLSSEQALIFIPEDVRDECERVARELIKPSQSRLPTS
ncbi:MAG: HD domain-containing protein [Candidatus Thermoplasmatota archaeon]|nr:HD domain-containing protein [Candidatus Thermoplasmatota archaeon]|tara:strand:+ start:2864 stop:4153 length:1290 start_codon:yes stop_codon:yes gene_type:complete